MAEQKCVEILLYDGEFDSIVKLNSSKKDMLVVYYAPRNKAKELLKIEDLKNSGIYLLLSEDRFYVGQTNDFSTRIDSHLSQKDWWKNVAIMTSVKNDFFNKTDEDYLEAELIKLGNEYGIMDSENKQKGNRNTVKENRKFVLDQYLEEFLWLIKIVDIHTFDHKHKTAFSRMPMDIYTALGLGVKQKDNAIKFLQDEKVPICKKNLNYACINKTLYKGKAVYWIEPNEKCLADDWTLILNDTRNRHIKVLRIQAKTINDSNGLLKRRGNKLELNLDADTLKDVDSGYDFSVYCDGKYPYK